MNITVEKTPVLELTRNFDAAPERVFDAWLERSWGDWIGPGAVTAEVTLLEPRVGGRYRIVMHTPDGKELTVHGVYKEINRPHQLVMSWIWEHGDTETILSLSFKPSNSGTELTIRHEGFSSEERRDNHNRGWNGTLDKLEASMRKGCGTVSSSDEDGDIPS